MRSLYRAELFKLALLSIIGVLLGNLFGQLWLGLSLALLFYILMQLNHYSRYDQWLSSGAKQQKPFTNVFWSTIMDQIQRLLGQLRGEIQQLESDVDYFKESFQALESGVVVLDKEGRIDWCNLAAKSLLGIELNRDRGEPFVNLVRAPSVNQYLETKAYAGTLELASPRAADLMLEIQATVFRQDYTLVFARDISELYKLETMRRDFVANVSHELRTPLTVITGYLDTLKEHNRDAPPIYARAVEQMLEQSKRMDSMVEDLIWLSRLESVPVSQHSTEQVDLYGLLSSVVADSRQAYLQKSISLEFDESSFAQISAASPKNALAQPVQMQGSYKELHSAIGNLVQNAAKYSADQAEIKVECYARKASVYISVSDNGFGIDPVHIPRLTERFYRIDSSRTGASGGTGLGLAIVKHALARHDAQLQIRSKLGVGSTFACEFPLSRLQLASEPKCAPATVQSLLI